MSFIPSAATEARSADHNRLQNRDSDDAHPAIKKVIDNKADVDHPHSEKANTVQPNWSAPTLLNSWANKADGPDAGYLKDTLRFVRVRGRLDAASSTADTVFTLPAGYRPATEHRFRCPASATGGELDVQVNIDTDGSVTVSRSQVSGTFDWVDISGIPPFDTR